MYTLKAVPFDIKAHWYLLEFERLMVFQKFQIVPIYQMQFLSCEAENIKNKRHTISISE